MKAFNSLLLLLAITISAYAQVPGWAWARNAGGNNYNQAESMTSDNAGNVFVAGYFNCDSLFSGSNVLVNAAVPGTLVSEAFVVKYDANGNIQWARSVQGTGVDRALTVSVDPAGNVYMAGYFQSDTIRIDTVTFTTSGSGDIFLVKYDANGNFIWARKAGGNGLDTPGSVAADANGNVYMAGKFSSNFIVFATDTLHLSSDRDMFLAKYNTSGNLLWVEKFGGGGDDEATALAVDSSGHVFLGGFYSSSAFVIDTITLAKTGVYATLMAKINADGSVVWAKKGSGNSDDRINAMAIDASGNSYGVGIFNGDSLSFGAIMLHNGDNTSSNTFVVKYDPSGNALWAHNAGGSSTGRGAAVDPSGNVYATGEFKDDSIVFSSGVRIMNTSSVADPFLVKYDPSGNVQWAIRQSSGGTDIEIPFAATSDASGNIYMAGDYADDSITFGPSLLTKSGVHFDMFVAKLGTTTGINDVASQSGEIIVYPNPSCGKFNITLRESALKIEGIEVYNLLGEKVYQSVLQSATANIDLSDKSNGIYLLKVNTPDGSVTQKMVIQR